MSSKEKLLEAKILELEAKIKNLKDKKKYGLVWDDLKNPEEVVKLCKTNIPVLKEVKSKEIISDKNKISNILIEGDNYYALSVLNYTHQGKVGVIYIDPPYNTGEKDFIYNDEYIDLDDSYRHSKWLSFMERRLELAKNLLTDEGVIFISIDNNEQANLKLLCDKIFGETSFIANIGLEITKTQGMKVRSAQLGSIVKNYEYVLVYSRNPDRKIVKNILYDKINYFDTHFNLIYKHPKITSINALFMEKTFSKYIDEYKKIKNIKKFSLRYINDLCLLLPEFRDELYKHSNEICRLMDCDISLSKSELNLIKVDKIVSIRGYFITKVSTGKIQQLAFLSDGIKQSDDFSSELARCSIRGDLWKGFYSDMMNVEKEGGVEFKNGKKPLRLIKQLIKWVSNKEDIVLDFFAGSGTTGHAVLDLNKEDTGNRQFILCTNNENKICEDITLSRIKNVILRSRDSNLKYFKTTLIPKSYNRDEMKIRVTEECTEMLCVREGIYEEIKNKSAYKIFKQGEKIMAVYYFLSQKELPNLKKDLDKMEGEKILYCFTLDPLGLNESDFEDWRDVRLEPIPQKILDIYKEIHEY